jgi:hypothetical protein
MSLSEVISNQKVDVVLGNAGHHANETPSKLPRALKVVARYGCEVPDTDA